MSDSRYTGGVGDLSEKETLARLTTEEKRKLAEPAIMEFPHLTHEMVDEWLRSAGANHVSVNDGLRTKVEKLLDALEQQVEQGEDPEALDNFIHGQVYPAALEVQGIDPDEVAERDPDRA